MAREYVFSHVVGKPKRKRGKERRIKIEGRNI